MNRSLKQTLWLLLAATLIATSCTKKEDIVPQPQPEPQPEVKVELALSVGEVTSTTIIYTITPNQESAPYYVEVFAAEELAEERDIAVKAALMIMEEAYTGKQTFTADELAAEKEYKILYFGYDANQKRYLTDYIVSEPIKTANFEIDGSMALSLVEGSETWRDAFVKILPSDESMEYIFDIMEKGKWESLYAENPESIVDVRIAGWEQDVKDGINNYPDLDTWQKYMQFYQNSRTKTISVSEYCNLRWSTEYVMYAFGMNDDGYQTTDVVTVEFTTTTPEASNNSFVVEIGELTDSTVSFTVTTTNNDPYFLTIQDKRYVDLFFGEEASKTWEDMVWDLTFVKTDAQIQKYIFNGSQSLTNEDINKTIDTLHEYQVVIWGFDNGPTTEVYVSDVFQPIDAA